MEREEKESTLGSHLNCDPTGQVYSCAYSHFLLFLLLMKVVGAWMSRDLSEGQRTTFRIVLSFHI